MKDTTLQTHVLIEGILYKRAAHLYYVRADGHTIPCTLSTRFGKDNGQQSHKSKKKAASHKNNRNDRIPYNPDPLITGDRVQISINPDGTGSIVTQLERRNTLYRRSAAPMPGAHAGRQLIAANIDQIVPVFAIAEPEPKWNMLDRYLVLAESQDIPALVCISKQDLASHKQPDLQAELDAIVDVYRRIGYPVCVLSTHTGQGMQAFIDALKGKTSILMGKSGVGKSSLLNAIQPGLGLDTAAISNATGKGRHTTTTLEMFPLDMGGAIIDTPGMREFGLLDIDADELADFFPEMLPYLGQCHFGMDCRHDEEPGCAIRQAVTKGAIDPRRYQSYMRIKEDL